MYSNLNLYYLNQLGITPWVNKSDSIQSRGGSAHSLVKLLVVLPGVLTKDASFLLNQLITYLNILESQFKIVHLTHVGDELNQQLINMQMDSNCTQVIWSLGLKQKSIPQNLNNLVVFSDSIDHLISHPIAKKGMLQDLSFIKQQLSVIE